MKTITEIVHRKEAVVPGSATEERSEPAARQRFGSLIAGQQPGPGSIDGALVEPSTGRQWGSVSVDPSHVDAAVESARRALVDSTWSVLDASQRGRLLHRLADLVEQHADEIARLEVLSSGKTLRVTTREVARAAAWYRFFGGAADKLDGASIELGPSSEARVLYEPVGVVVAITPTNGPISLGTWKIAPALAMGNVVVVKPPIEAPASTCLLGQLALRAGLPPGVLNVVPGGADIGGALATHSGVAMVSFTGSTAAAKQLGGHVTARMKRFVCEAGGKSAQIVFADSDLDGALVQARQGVFSNAGQSCVAGARLLVQKPVFDSFLERLVASTKLLRVGDPLADTTHVGPLASARQRDKVVRLVDEAIGQGATALAGGRPPDLSAPFDGGFFYAPTILAGVSSQMPVWREEIFGPVVVVCAFETEEEAVALANDSNYGLAASVWTNDIRRAHRVSRRLAAGTVWINTYRTMHYRVPFGGYKESGLGRENGLETLRNFVNVKAVVTDHAPPVDAFAY